MSTKTVRINVPVIQLYVTDFFLDSEDSDDDGDTEEPEEWECKKDGCSAKIEVNKDNVLVGHRGIHMCETVLKMEIISNYGVLGAYTFLKEPGTLLALLLPS